MISIGSVEIQSSLSHPAETIHRPHAPLFKRMGEFPNNDRFSFIYFMGI